LIIGVGNGSSYENTTASITLLPTYAQLITTSQVLDPVAAEYGIATKDLRSVLTVEPASNTQIIRISVTDGNPQRATQLTNAVAQSFQRFTSTQFGNVVQFTVILSVVNPDPIRPKPTSDTLIGALVGLGLSLALIVIFEWIDDRLSNPEEVQPLLGIDALTVIPELSAKQRKKNVTETPALAESCRILCAALNLAQTRHPFKLVMVTSALTGEGKSTIAANVATFLAMSGKRVLLVDADLRDPALSQHFQLDNFKGLSNVFSDSWAQAKNELEGQPTEIPSLRVLTSGVRPSNPPELLQSHLAHQLFNHFRNTPHFDYVLFDTPPVLPVADTQILASYIQAAILVVDASKTPRRVLKHARQLLTRTGTRVLGVAINKSQWPEFGQIHEYLHNQQTQGPGTDIAVSLPPAAGDVLSSSIEAANTTILPITPKK
jgi:capsular exopolysaccharide synthesis family protein